MSPNKTREIIIESKKHGKHTVLVDEEDWTALNEEYENLSLYVSINNRKRHNRYQRLAYVMARYGPYGHSPSQRKEKALHRLIMKPAPGLVVDHISGETLDNRRSNLRVCTNAENSRNSQRIYTSKTGYKGVHSASANGSFLPWRARIKHNYKEIQLGTFATKEEAALAFDNASRKYFGEFARLNFPEGPSEEVLQIIEDGRTAAAARMQQKLDSRDSKYTGVRYEPRSGSTIRPWRAHLNFESKYYYCGGWATEEAAALAYDKKRMELTNSSKGFNFPNGVTSEVLSKITKGEERAKMILAAKGRGTSSSGYKGVTKASGTRDRWIARIVYDGKRHYLGSFGDKEEAARAVDQKAIEIYGEFANLNFPEEHNRKE